MSKRRGADYEYQGSEAGQMELRGICQEIAISEEALKAVEV